MGLSFGARDDEVCAVITKGHQTFRNMSIVPLAELHEQSVCPLTLIPIRGVCEHAVSCRDVERKPCDSCTQEVPLGAGKEWKGFEMSRTCNN